MSRRESGSAVRNSRPGSNRDRPSVKSVSRAVKILSCLGDGVNTITDIAHSCTLSKSTVYRLLRALEESQLAMQESRTHRYYLGPLLTKLASNPLTTHEHLVTCAIQEMNRLVDLVEETVTLGVMIALQYVILHEIASTHDLRVTEENRRLGSLNAGATVKVLLSQFSDEQLKTVMKHIVITPATPNTVIDKQVLLTQVKEARLKGYAFTYGEKIPGALGMAVPVLHYPYPAALSIIGPETRIKPRIDFFLKELIASGRKISGNVADILKD